MSAGYTPLKHYFGSELALRLGESILPQYPVFPLDRFVSAVAAGAETLELKARVRLIAEQLHEALPMDYPEQAAILLNILGPEIEGEQGMFTQGYFLMPVAYFVERYGLSHVPISMNALYEITKRHTSEYAIRPYLLLQPEQCIRTLTAWSFDANAHVRRLVSEGTRPRLPWAKRIPVLQGDPMCNLALLEPLLNDPSGYVRKSVANHLNDLAKEHKHIVLGWMDDRLRDGWEHGPRVVRHALRTLAKSGDPDAMAMIADL